MREDWIVVALAGVTNSGKTTVTKKLHSIIPNSECIFQDLYFRDPNDPNHKYVEDLKHNNWELLTAINTDKMWTDIEEILRRPRIDPSKKNVLLIDGFLVLNFLKTVELCDLKYYLRLSKEVTWERRQTRSYDPPDVPGYFEQIVWPEHLKSFQQMLEMNKCVVLIHGTCPVQFTTERILQDIECRL
ncbi:unnamed protein product [Bemisia tabaci]|uniref:Nicotinamide riboside kinase 1 n=1 Tax=Bemisia tabaci TaxID=7038 RepID=A0A9P0ABM1_BEMTA|nr:PREDICTED: nicotinamide riboside kinase 1-like [Bemisia tabaci]XP_018898166.1 PREDICTED: nicotinamide riboside kinase 1-like [Bemisia tabaci]CAH0387906.1 unnamed protein product [Bemisia tabaci]